MPLPSATAFTVMATACSSYNASPSGLCTKNTSWALIERPYSCAPQAVGAVYDRPGFFVQSREIATKMHKIHKMLLCVLCLFVASLPSASAQNNNSRDALFAAIQRGAIGDVERLLKNGVSSSLTDVEGTPALMAAILFADSRMVELLLQHSADANQSGPSGTTALMWAMPDLAKARLLIAHGA